MKRPGRLALALAIVFLLSGCAADARPDDCAETGNLTLLDFSYEEDTAEYKAGDPGVKSYDFVNVSSQPIDSRDRALELAKNECTVEYDTTRVYYDGGAAMWKVSFSTAGTAGGGQTVYLDSSGITCLIVYGE